MVKIKTTSVLKKGKTQKQNDKNKNKQNSDSEIQTSQEEKSSQSSYSDNDSEFEQEIQNIKKRSSKGRFIKKENSTKQNKVQKVQLIKDSDNISEDNSSDDSEDQEDLYEIEFIQGKKRQLNKNKQSKYQYFIKWYGYPESQNTYEPPEHIMNKDLILQYEQIQQKQIIQKLLNLHELPECWINSKLHETEVQNQLIKRSSQIEQSQQNISTRNKEVNQEQKNQPNKKQSISKQQVNTENIQNQSDKKQNIEKEIPIGKKTRSKLNQNASNLENSQSQQNNSNTNKNNNNNSSGLKRKNSNSLNNEEKSSKVDKKVQNLTTKTADQNKNSDKIVIKQNESQNQIKQDISNFDAQGHGTFQMNDKAIGISKHKVVMSDENNQAILFFKVIWAPRSNGQTPLQTYFNYENVKKNATLVLLDYYYNNSVLTVQKPNKIGFAEPKIEISNKNEKIEKVSESQILKNIK